MARILIPSGPHRLVGDLFPPVGSSGEAGPGLLFIHGYASGRATYAQRAAGASQRLRATCLTFDLSGHGESPGDLDRLSRVDHLGDVLAAYDRLVTTEGVDPGRVGVCGASYGGYLACLLLSHRPVARLMLRAPALYFSLEDSPGSGRWQGVEDPARPNPALRNLSGFAGRTLVVESGEDEVIPHRVIQRYLDSSDLVAHHVIEGAGHALTRDDWRAEFQRLVVDWFWEL